MRQCLVFFLLLLFSLAAIGQPGSAGNIPVVIEQIPPGGILLDKGWKFLAGDNPKFANPTFDDTEWESINLTLDIYYQPQIRKAPVGWFRIKLHIDSSLLNKPLAFQVYQSIASEIYLDGKLLQRYGTVSHNRSEIKAFQPNNELVGLQFNKTEHTIAVRFSVQNNLPYFTYNLPFTIFNFRINTVSNATVAFKHFVIPGYRFLEVFEVGLFLVIALIHL